MQGQGTGQVVPGGSQPSRSIGNCGCLDALLGKKRNQTSKEGMGAGTKGQRTGRQRDRSAQEEEAGKAGEERPVRQRERAGVVTKAGRARPEQRRDISDQRNSPPGRQKHRVSIWHKVSTERSKIPLSIIRNVLNQ